MTFAIAIIRLILMMLALLLGTLIVVVLSMFRLRTAAGVPWTLLVIEWLCRNMFGVLGIDYICTEEDRAKLRAHRGIIFSNHLSTLDTPILLTSAPMRFLAAIGVKKIPIFGTVATAIDTIYVNRHKKDSRSQAREEITEQVRAQPYPPLALFPEGVTGKGKEVEPFRYGAFDIVLDGQFPCLLCVLNYEPFEAASYYEDDDNIPKAIWRLVSHRGGLKARLTVLDVLDLSQGLDNKGLAEQAQAKIQAVYAKIQTDLYKQSSL